MTGHVRKKGNTWYYSFELDKVNGKRKRVERIGGATKKEAEKALRKALDEYEAEGTVIKESALSVSSYFEYWFENHVLLNYKYNTQLYYKTLIEKHINPTLGYYKLKDITPKILQEFINKKSLSGFGKSSLSSLKSTLSVAFKYAVHPYEFIKKNPMEHIITPTSKQNKLTLEEKIISPDDFSRIIERFDEKTSFYLPLIIGYCTGARISEVFALTWEDINFEEKTLDINKQVLKKGKHWYFETPKTSDSDRLIPIGDTLLDILKKHKETQFSNKEKYGEFFCKNYEVKEISSFGSQRRIARVSDYSQSVVGKELFFLCTKENGDIITPESFKYASRVIHHELNINFEFRFFRHTHATLLIESGAKFKAVQNRLGHNNFNTTLQTYTHITKKSAIETGDLFENIINSLLKK